MLHGLPIVVEGAVWGELWAASTSRRLGPPDVLPLSACAAAIGRALAARHVS